MRKTLYKIGYNFYIENEIRSFQIQICLMTFPRASIFQMRIQIQIQTCLTTFPRA